MGLATGGQPYQSTPAGKEGVGRPTLRDAGIDHKLSSRAQKLDAVLEEKFKGMIGEGRERVQQENERVTESLLREAERAATAAGLLVPADRAA